MTMSRTGRIGRGIAAATLALTLGAGAAAAATVANQRENTFVNGTTGLIDLAVTGAGTNTLEFAFTWSGVTDYDNSVAATIEFQLDAPADIFFDQYDTSDGGATSFLSLAQIPAFGAPLGAETAVTGSRTCDFTPSSRINSAGVCSFVSETSAGADYLPGTNPILANLSAGHYRLGLAEVGLSASEDPLVPEFGRFPEDTLGDGVVLRVEEIPLPATHLMLIGALGTVVALRRRKQAAR